MLLSYFISYGQGSVNMRHVHWLFFAVATLALAPAWAQPPTAPAQLTQFSGTIDSRDRRDSNGRRYEEHNVRLEAGERYRVSVMSSRFDPIVEVFQPGESRLRPAAEDDDSGPGDNARVIFIPAVSGNHVIRALSFLPGGAGSYFLRVEPALAFPPPLPTQLPRERAADTTVWTSYPGSLTEADPSLDGVHFDDYLVTLAAGEELIIRLDSEAFDPFVQIFRGDERENEVLAADDDSGLERNSLLLFAPVQAGDYVVRVTAWGTALQRGFVGDYRLRIGR